MNRGSTNVWHENWTGLGALYHVFPPEFPINEELQEVAELRDEEHWNDQLLDQSFPQDIADHIRHEVHFAAANDYWDTPRWMHISSSKFTVSTAWRILRNIEPSNPEFAKLWTKGLHFKISFFLWRVWKVEVPTDDLWRRGVEDIPTSCRFGDQLGTGSSSYKGMVECKVLSQVKAFVPSCSNSCFMGALKEKEYNEAWWDSNCKPHVVTKRVTWQLPYEGWFKCNIDGASRGNPGPSSYGFCVRDHEGNLVFAKAKEIGEATNIVSEAKAIAEGLAYCMERHLHPLIMETDSLGMRKIIDDAWETPWCIGAEVRRIKEIKSTITFHSFHELPAEGKTLINMDKSQILNLWVKVAKRRALDL
uniref:Uncharacterized protein LOC104220585 n=1 Tax=Nicotiana sylvestris TaxID=4096 RepID=A0A1U7VPF2_NICSY|nr:PREDICTED: uncharacterized protein LOC104220585 [Nicotiana sylvestris]